MEVMSSFQAIFVYSPSQNSFLKVIDFFLFPPPLLSEHFKIQFLFKLETMRTRDAAQWESA